MPPAKLVLRNLFAHKLRLFLTVGSLTVAVFLIIVLRCLIVALDAGVRAAQSNRLVVQSAVSLYVSLPEAYEVKIRNVEGVDEVTKFQWFGGIYQDPANFFAQFAVDPVQFLDIYPEVELLDGTFDAFLSGRRACLIGESLAGRFDWKVGDTVPLQGTIFPRLDGEPWTFEVAGVYTAESPNVDKSALFFHFDYLREGLEGGSADGPEGTGTFVLRTAPGVDQVELMAEVDALFENGPQVVQTTSEAEFNAQFVSMLGNVPFFLGAIGGGILAAILLATLNTMLMAGREQTRDVGILKALGFSDGTVFGVLLVQSFLLCGVGGGVGIALAYVSGPGISAVLGTMFPGFRIASEVVLQTALIVVLLGLVAGIAPALRARRMTAIDAIRAEGV